MMTSTRFSYSSTAIAGDIKATHRLSGLRALLRYAFAAARHSEDRSITRRGMSILATNYCVYLQCFHSTAFL